VAAIVWTDVTALAPELGTTAAQTQTDVLAFVNAALAVSLYDGEGGPRTRLSRIYLAAHLATMPRLGAGGALVGESAGGLSRQYAAPMTRSNLGKTSYGVAFLSLSPPAARGPQVL
jgi:hypothetical protein